MSQFTDLGVPARLVTTLTAQGITEPFPIQRDTLPDTLAGRDVLGRGRTGSGKTLAFALPLVARLAGTLAGGARRSGRPLALVLAPTRELATQIAAVIEPLATASSLKVTTIYGGVSQQRQEQALRAGVDIVVACPGRLEDLMRQRLVTLDAIEVTVLDEADHMADLGFLPVVTRIMAATPAAGQRLLFSATLDNGVDKIVSRFLHTPATHSVDDANSHVERMSHAVLAVADAEVKKQVLQELASGSERRILFVRTKHVAKKLAQQLTASGVPAVDLQGNLSQGARDRNLAAFQDGSVRVLVATDVAARGVHVDDVALVIHADPPTEHKAYLHRSGRTARAGAAGTVVTLVMPAQEKDLKILLRKAAIDALPVPVTPRSDVVSELVGERAAFVAPAPRAAVQQQQGQRQQGRQQQSRQARSPQPARTRGGASGGRGARPASSSSQVPKRGSRQGSGSAPVTYSTGYAGTGYGSGSGSSGSGSNAAPRRSGPRRASRG